MAIDIPYSLVVEATREPDYFGFFSPDLEGFTGVGHSMQDSCRAPADSHLRLAYRSSRRRPARLAILASIRGPISTPWWKDQTKSGQPGRSRTLWEPSASRLTRHPIERSALRTRRALVAGQCAIRRRWKAGEG